jgi:plastocyanin
MNRIVHTNAKARQSATLASLLVILSLWNANAGDKPSSNTTMQSYGTVPLRIFDQYGREAFSGTRETDSQTFDVAVGPGTDLAFVPNTVNISVGDTVRWTWESDFHSVTSGVPCTPDGQFCSPDNMNCDAGILNNTGFVYEFTFTQPGMYQYFCALHCFAGMTGVVNVLPAVRTRPTPRPRPTPYPRP